jgi:DNA-binding PadR family transcriptional regulator
MDRFRPETFLPLTAVAFEIMLALADGEQHGYSIMREVAEQSDGAVTLHAGTLYRALARLLESGLIEELDERPAFPRTHAMRASAGKPVEAHDDERRRYYRLTDRGIAVARAEAERMANQVNAARGRKLLRVRA